MIPNLILTTFSAFPPNQNQNQNQKKISKKTPPISVDLLHVKNQNQKKKNKIHKKFTNLNRLFLVVFWFKNLFFGTFLTPATSCLGDLSAKEPTRPRIIRSFKYPWLHAYTALHGFDALLNGTFANETNPHTIVCFCSLA